MIQPARKNTVSGNGPLHFRNVYYAFPGTDPPKNTVSGNIYIYIYIYIYMHFRNGPTSGSLELIEVITPLPEVASRLAATNGLTCLRSCVRMDLFREIS